jgi:subtilisin family serine protease
MRRSLAIVPLLLAAACSDGRAPLSPRGAPSAARVADGPGDYVVVLKDDANPRAVAALLGATPRHVFTASLKGFAGHLDAGQLAGLRRNPAVAYVERDAPVRLFTTQRLPVWGIDRVDERTLPLSNTFTYTSDGAGVTVYVLDTGVRKTHREFAGRADYIDNGVKGDFVGDGHGSAEDCHGHGTHVSGTIAGTGYGVAKGARIRAGRVVDCTGNGTASMAIAGMDWIIANGSKPAVVNMSLGYGDLQSVRDMARRLYGAGYVVVAAAGNGDYAGTPQNACLESPAGAPNAITVGATTSTDAEASFSNYGTCVDILAPGYAVISAGITSDSARATLSGTSMAAPHVSGAAAQYLRLHTAAPPLAVWNDLSINATSGAISRHALSVANGTPNRLLFTSY